MEHGKRCGRELGPRVQRWCPIHKPMVRARQLAKSQKKYLTHRGAPRANSVHLFYKNQVTRWAKKNPDKAVAIWKRRYPDETVPPELLALKPLSKLTLAPDETLLST